RPRLMTDTFHQIAVTGDDVGPVVDDFGPVLGREMTFGEGHADGSRQSLAERAGRGLDPGGVPILRVTGRAAPELPEVFDVVQGYRSVAGQMQQRIQQHRAVSRGEHEAV